MRSTKHGARNALLAAAGLCLLWTAARANPEAARPASDPRDAEIQILKDEVHSLAAKVDALVARANSAPPVTQVPVAAAPASAAVTIASGKPSIQSADGRFTANLHGIMQFDAADYRQSTPGPITADFRRGAAATDTAHARDLNSGTNMRRARIGVDGKAFGDWDYNVLLDFGGAGEEDAGHVQELWVQYSGLKPFHARVGAFSPSVGLEDQGSTNGMLFLERPASADIARGLAAGDFREGAEIWAAGDKWYVNAGVTGRLVGVVNSQATGVSQPYDSQLGLIGRADFIPIKTASGMLVVGVHGSHVAKPADTGGPDTAVGATRYSITLQERPELRVDGTRLISTGGLNAKHVDDVGLEAAGQFKSLFLQAEYDAFKIDRRNAAAGVSNPSFKGFYVEGAYSLTGERRKFNPGTFAFDAPPVAHPFSRADGTWGAFEVAVRYSDMDLNYHPGAFGAAPSADAVRGGDQRVIAAGLNWYPNTFVRLMLDIQDVRIDRLSPSAATFLTPAGAQIGQHFQAISLRSQFAF